MIFKRNELIDKSLSIIDNYNVLLLKGGFGTGKSTLAIELANQLLNENNIDGYFKFSELTKISYSEFGFNLALNYRDTSNDEYPLEADETARTQANYQDLISRLEKLCNPKIFSKIVRSNTFYYNPLSEIDVFDFDENDISNERDRFLINNLNSIITESIIVDLVKKYFPLNDSFASLEHYILNGEKRKIMVIIDDYDPIKEKLEKFLSLIFIPYLLEKKFSDFLAFDLSNENQTIKVSDLFEFKIILASRKEFQKELINNNQIEVNNFSEDELKELLKQKSLDTDTYFNDFAYITKGNPFITSLLIESVEINASSFDMLRIYALVDEQLFKYTAEEQMIWIKSVSFFDGFDELALRLIPELKNHSFRVYEYLKKCNDFFIIEDNKIEMNSFIKEYIHTSINYNSKEFADKLISFSNVYKQIAQIKDQYTNEEFQLLLSLSYFAKFDVVNVIEKISGFDKDKIYIFLDKNKSIIYKKNFVYSIPDKIRNELILFNKYCDEENYELMKAKSKSIWFEYLEKLNKNKDLFKIEIKQIHNQIETLKKQQKEFNSKIDLKQNKFIETENNILELNKKLKPFVTYKNNFLAMLILISAFIFLAIGLFKNAILSQIFIDKETIEYAGYIAYIFSALLFLLSSKSIYRWSRSLIKKDQIKEWKEILKSNKSEQDNLKNALTINNADNMANNAKIEELNKDIYNLGIKIEEIENKKSESFI